MTHRQVFVSGQLIDIYRGQPRYANLLPADTPHGHPILEFRSGLAARKFTPAPGLVSFCLEFFRQHAGLEEREYLTALQGALQREFPEARGGLESDADFQVRLEQEIGGAKLALEREFKKPIFAFAFPWGQYCAESLAAAQRHYAVAARVLPSRTNVARRPFELDRIEIPGAACQELKKAMYACAPWEPLAFKGAPEVCVLMTTYNRRSTLADAIQSVVDQTFTNWNLIVVNDGGENVADIIAQFDDPRIRYLDRPHAGKCAALNAAILDSASRYIAYLDDDDRYLPNHLEVLISFLRRHPEKLFVHSMAEEVSTIPVEGGGWQEHSRGIRYAGPVKMAALRFNNFIPNLCAVHARELFAKAGRFDESLEVLIDWDMYRRLALVSAPEFVNIKTAEYYRRVTPENRAVGQITGLIATDPVRYYRHRLRVLRKPGYERFQSPKEAAALVLLEDDTRDDLDFAWRYAQVRNECPVELVVLAACSLDDRSILAVRLAEMLGGLVLWDEERVGGEALLQAYLREPWARKSLIFDNDGSLGLEDLRSGLAAAGTVQDFRGRNRSEECVGLKAEGGAGVSIIVPGPTSVDHLCECIRAIARFKPTGRPFEVIIAGGGSGVLSTEAIDRLAAEHPWICVAPGPLDGGTTAAKNRAVKMARHALLVFLEEFSTVQNGWLEPLIGAFERHPALAVVGCKGLFPDGTTVHAGVLILQDETASGALSYLMTHHRRPFHQAEAMRRQDCRALMRGGIAVRRSAFEKVAGFDPELGLGYEDVDLCLRVAEAGGRIGFEPGSLVLHREANIIFDGHAMARAQRRFSAKWRGKLQPDVVREAGGNLRRINRADDRTPGEEIASPASSDPTPAPRRTGGAGAAPVVSVIIPVFNQLAFTRQCLDRLDEDRPAAEVEVVVVDNGSTDGTREWLAEREREGKLRVIVNSRNCGFAVACNQGARAARGTYALFLNNDTEPRPGWLDPLLEIAERDPSVAAVGSRLLFPDGTVQHAGVGIFEDQRSHDPLQGRNLGVGSPADAPEVCQLRELQALTAACLLVRRSTFLEVGGFDEGYWNGYEDVDLCFKLRERGGKLVYQPASVVVHHESKSGPERFAKARENILRLHARWRGRICPDFILTGDGRVVETGVGGIGPYVPGGASAPLVSIIILAHDQLEHTRRCLESLFRNTSLPHEIVIVDNASTDGTAGYLAGLLSQNARLRVITNRRNLGFAAGNNQGLAIARGEFLVLLNNDTVVTPNWLESMLAVLRRHPGTGIVGPRSNRVSGPQQVENVGYHSLEELPAFADRWGDEHAGQSRSVSRVVGFCLMARQTVIARIGGLDEQFGSGNFEDDDFCLRARLAGFEARIADEAFIHHVGSATFHGARIDYRQAMLTNWNRFKQKWRIPPETPVERGYPTPSVLPPGAGMAVPLPKLSATHACSEDGRCWTDTGVSAGQVASTAVTVRPGALASPPTVAAGNLAAARELQRQKKLPAAWAATLAALKARAFHPEAYFLLAEIAQAAGDGGSAERCIRYVQKLAPKFRPNDPLLKAKFRGSARPDWLVLPESVGGREGPVESQVVANGKRPAEAGELLMR